MNRNILILLLVCFLDMLSYAIFSPVTPFLFLEGTYSLLPAGYCNRYLLFGFFLSTYSMTQVFSSPFLGKLALSLSKKAVLLLSFVGNVVGYLLCAYGIHTSSVAFLFLGSAAAGLTGANMSMINAFISTETDRSHWSRNYSLFGAIIGVSFIVGPQISALFIRFFEGFTSYYYLLLFCSFLSVLNCILVYSLIFESKTDFLNYERYMAKKNKQKLPSFLKIEKGLIPILLFLFCVYFSWLSFIKFFQVYLVDVLSLKETECLEMTSFLGFSSCLWQSLRYLLKTRFSEKYTWLLLCACLMLVNFGFYTWIESTRSLRFVTLCLSFSYAVLTPSILSLLFKRGQAPHAYKSSWYQSLKSLAQILAPLSSGYVLSQNIFSPNLLTVLVMMFSVLILVIYRRIFDSTYEDPSSEVLSEDLEFKKTH